MTGVGPPKRFPMRRIELILAYFIVRARQALAVPCSTSKHGDYPALATWKMNGNKTNPVWACLWSASCIFPYTPICVDSHAVPWHGAATNITCTYCSHTRNTDKCWPWDSQYVVLCLQFSPHCAYIVHPYLQIHAHTCKYITLLMYLQVCCQCFL